MSVKGVAIIIIVFAALCVCAVAQETPPPMPGEELPAGAEALTSGPVHEAFAMPVILETQAGVVALKPPPAMIAEVPPAQRPEGANVAWVPGYWAWDAARVDYIWVSGCWRVAPPGMYWVPGYWTPIAGGWEWVAGFWKVTEQTQEIEYLTAPPAPVEVSPPGPAPSPDVVWVPGCWYWDQGRYVQRHGYWLPPHTGWVWVPSHYSWSPHGYIFCGGHWDYDMDRRGVLFTPVYFPPAVVAQAGFVFSPSLCVDLGALKINLFTYPRYSHYYFGDCYDDASLSIGIYPWFECERLHTWYDPVFVYERWNARKEGPAWETRERKDYDVRRADPAQRPPRTFSEQQVRMAKMPEVQRAHFQVAQPLKTFVAARTTPMKFEQINAVERQKVAVQAKEVHNFRDQRTQWEAPKKGPATPAERKGPEAPAEHKVETPAEHKGPETPAEHKGPVTPAEHKVETPAEHKGPEAPAERKGPEAPKGPTENKPVIVPPREVHVTAPEKVKIPPAPIAHKTDQPSPPERVAPTHPAEEHSHVVAPKDTPKVTPKDTPKDAPKDTPKNAPKDAPKDTSKNDGKPDGKGDGKGDAKGQ